MRQAPLLLGALILAACGGDKGTGPTTGSTGPAPVASVVVTPNTHTLTSIDATQQFQASARDAAGATISGKVFVWTSSSSAVATVDPTGLVTAVTNGASTITATVDGIESNPVAVTVAQALAIIEVTPADETLIALGDASVFAASGTDAMGNPMDGFVWEWSSSNEAVATVDAEGNATAQGAGSTSITATAAGVSGSGQLIVNPVPAARLEMPESVGVGDQVSVDVQLLTAGYGSSTGAFAFTVNFDPSVLQYNVGSTAYYVALVFDNTGGNIRMVASVPTGIADNFTAATIVFDVVGGAGGPTDLDVSIDRLIAALIFTDFTVDGVGQTRSLIIQ